MNSEYKKTNLGFQHEVDVRYQISKILKKYKASKGNIVYHNDVYQNLVLDE